MLTFNNSKKSITITTGCVKAINNLLQNISKTLNMDNDKESVWRFSCRLADVKTFFCDPDGSNKEVSRENELYDLYDLLSQYRYYNHYAKAS